MLYRPERILRRHSRLNAPGPREAAAVQRRTFLGRLLKGRRRERVSACSPEKPFKLRDAQRQSRIGRFWACPRTPLPRGTALSAFGAGECSAGIPPSRLSLAANLRATSTKASRFVSSSRRSVRGGRRWGPCLTMLVDAAPRPKTARPHGGMAIGVRPLC